MLSRWRLLALFLLITLTTGCNSGKNVTLSGSVTIDGQPVENGSLTFIQEGGVGQTAGAIITAGKYTASEVPVGKLRVTFQATRKTGKMLPGYSEPIPETVNIIPPKYRDGQSIEVKSSQSQLDFTLSSE